MPSSRKPRNESLNMRGANDYDRMNAGQRKLIQRAEKAAAKAAEKEAAWKGAVAARNDLIRQALAAGVGQTLLANRIGLTRPFISKVDREDGGQS